MSKFTVNLSENEAVADEQKVPSFTEVNPPKKRRGCLKILGILGIFSLVILLIGAIGGYFYWQSVKQTPQYSLALIVDAARHDDKEKISQLIDTEQVVTNFTPQIVDQAVELYGRNLPPAVISKVSNLLPSLMPAIKDKAKAELPQLIREKTANVEKVPYWAIAVGAERALDIKIDGDTANITSKIPAKPLDLTMKKDGNLWKIVAIKDQSLAKKIAEKTGQQLIALVSKGQINQAGEILGTDKLGDILKNLNNIFK